MAECQDMKILQKIIFLEDYSRLKHHPVLKDFSIPSEQLGIATVSECVVALVKALL